MRCTAAHGQLLAFLLSAHHLSCPSYSSLLLFLLLLRLFFFFYFCFFCLFLQSSSLLSLLYYLSPAFFLIIPELTLLPGNYSPTYPSLPSDLPPLSAQMNLPTRHSDAFAPRTSFPLLSLPPKAFSDSLANFSSWAQHLSRQAQKL